jgi:hypothetical protein
LTTHAANAYRHGHFRRIARRLHRTASGSPTMPIYPTVRVAKAAVILAIVLTAWGCKKKDAPTPDEEPPAFQAFGAAEPDPEVAENTASGRLSPAEAFAPYDLEGRHERWEGARVLHRGEMWLVRGDHVGRTHRAQRQRRERFVLASPCSIVTSFGDGEAREQAVFSFVLDAENLFTVDGPAGLFVEKNGQGYEAVVCHDEAVTVFDGTECALWTFQWEGEGPEAHLTWARQPTTCSLEEKDVDGRKVRAFVYESTDGQRDVVEIQDDRLLYNHSTPLEPVEIVEDQVDARTRYNHVTRGHMADPRNLDAIMKDLQTSLQDRNKSGSIPHGWFDFDTSSHYEDISVKGCTLSARRIFETRDGDTVTKRSEKLTIDLSAVNAPGIGQQEVSVTDGRTRGRIARRIDFGTEGTTLQACASNGTACAPAPDHRVSLMFRNGEEALKAYTGLRRATMLCQADD